MVEEGRPGQVHYMHISIIIRELPFTPNGSNCLPGSSFAIDKEIRPRVCQAFGSTCITDAIQYLVKPDVAARFL